MTDVAGRGCETAERKAASLRRIVAEDCSATGGCGAGPWSVLSSDREEETCTKVQLYKVANYGTKISPLR